MAVLEEKDVMKMLEETEAVLHGHFLLTSGLHSPMYVEKFNVLQHPKYTERLCQEIARRYENDNVELVVGPDDRRYSVGSRGWQGSGHPCYLHRA